MVSAPASNVINQRTVIALIPAAGSGTRMGAACSKLLLPLGGCSLIERTLANIAESRYVQSVVVLAPADDLDRFREILPTSLRRGALPVRLVAGGATRQESVCKGLAYCAGMLTDPEDAYIAVHDGARCLATAELIDRAIEAALRHGAVTTAVPMADSLKQVDADGLVLKSVERDQIWAVQTPQVFRYTLLLAAHQQAAGTATDDAALVEHIHPVHVVEGSRVNFKITTPEDLVFAEKIISH